MANGLRGCPTWLGAVGSLLLFLLPAQARATETTAPTASAPAVATPARQMTLDEAVAFARAHHMRVASARARTEAAARETEVPSAQWLPRVGAMAQVVGSTVNNSSTTLLGTATVDLPRIGATRASNDPDFQPYASTAVAVGVRQQIYDFGRVSAERAAAELATAVERLRLTGAILDVDFAVKQAYFAVLAAEAIAAASQAAVARSASHRDLAHANVRSGLRPPIEATRAEADVARYETALARTRASVKVARIAFANAVGVDDAELAASSAPSGANPILPPIGQFEDGQERTPSVLEARARIDAQRAETRRLEVQTRPTLWATAAISGRAGGAPLTNGPSHGADGWIPTVPNYDAALVFTWPLVEPVWDRRADASRAREDAARAEADLTLRNQRALVRAAHEEARVAIEALSAANRSSEASRANWDQAEHRFGVGLGTSVELADAEALRTDAEIQLAIATFQASRARAALERAAATITSASEAR